MSEEIFALADRAARAQTRADLEAIAYGLQENLHDILDRIINHPGWKMESEAYREKFLSMF